MHEDDINFLEKQSLPSASDKLICTAEDWWNNACLNFVHNGWALYSTGYKEAADNLVDHVQETSRSQDTLVYPILFLYRQYLELTIKDIIRQGRKLKRISEPFPKRHEIDQLWKICSSLLSEIAPGDSTQEQKHIGRLIKEFCEVDPLSTAFRYPEDKNGNLSLPGISHINLRNVKDVISKISAILDGASAQIEEYLSLDSEMYGDSDSYSEPSEY